MNSSELENEIKKSLVSTVNKSTMINLIKQRFLVSSRPMTDMVFHDFSTVDSFAGSITKYKKDKIGLYGGVKHGS